jgi:putative peptidoglycan lipid II flippase
MYLYIKKRVKTFSIGFKKTNYLINFIKNAVPVLGAQILGSFSMFFYDFYSSSFSAGILTSISYSQRIFSLPSEMIINPISNILSTTFSKEGSSNSNKLLSTYIEYNNTIWFIIIPITFFLFFFSEPIIEIFYYRGSFTKENVIIASKSLKYFSLSLIGLSFVNVNSRLIYSIQKTKLISLFSLIIGILSVITTSIFCNKFGYIGISISRTFSVLFLSMLAGIILLYIYFKTFNILDIIKPLFKMVIAAIIVGNFTNYSFNFLLIKRW